MKRKAISFIVMIVMVLSLMPVNVFAEEEITEVQTASETAEEEITEVQTASETAEEETTEVLPANGIPVIQFNIEESEGHTIDDMNNSNDHSVTCTGTMDVIVPEVEGGFHYCDMDNVLESVSGLQLDYIRGRGNTTWGWPKKPYKIKLKEAYDLMGLGENKHWVLIANYGDQTLLNDRFTGWLGNEIGMEFTPRGVPVDVVMNGQNLGSYLLMEHIRIDTNRINIGKPKKKATDPKEITGGYLIQIGTQVDDYDADNFFTRRGQDMANDTPTFDPADEDCATDAQKEYIRTQFQNLEDALYGDNYKDSNGVRYSDYLDLESAAKYWLVMEASLNSDAYGTGSTYFYKKKDTFDADGNMTERGKFYYGPLWDFDCAWDYKNDDYPRFDTNHDWVVAMLYDEAFWQEIEKSWPLIMQKLDEASDDGGILDQYAEEVRASQAADQIIWEATREEYEKGFDFDSSISLFKTWVKNRANWMNDNMAALKNGVHKVTIKGDGVPDTSDYYRHGYALSHLIPPEREGYVFTGWLDENGKPLDGYAFTLTEDITIYADYVEEGKATKLTDLNFISDYACAEISDEFYYSRYSVYPENAQDTRIDWTSSDEEVATVDSEGLVRLIKPGTVEITATLKSGVSGSYVLIIKDDIPDPETYQLTPSVLTIKPGERAKLAYKVSPKISKANLIAFTSDDEEIATVDEAGVVQGKKPGTTTIQSSVTILAPVDEDEDKTISSTIKVVVSKWDNTLKASGKTVKVKARTLKKKNVKIARKKAITITKNKGTVSYKKVKGNKKITVNTKTGKITVKKGLKKGLYKVKVKVTAKGNSSYKAASKTVTVKIRVK